MQRYSKIGRLNTLGLSLQSCFKCRHLSPASLWVPQPKGGSQSQTLSCTYGCSTIILQIFGVYFQAIRHFTYASPRLTHQMREKYSGNCWLLPSNIVQKQEQLNQITETGTFKSMLELLEKNPDAQWHYSMSTRCSTLVQSPLLRLDCTCSLQSLMIYLLNN